MTFSFSGHTCGVSIYPLFIRVTTKSPKMSRSTPSYAFLTSNVRCMIYDSSCQKLLTDPLQEPFRIPRDQKILSAAVNDEIRVFADKCLNGFIGRRIWPDVQAVVADTVFNNEV